MPDDPANHINDDPATYGSKGQQWHPDFVAYMATIVAHPVYAGMPDAIKDDGKIQWEAPSNRKSGKYQHTHHRRLNWWREKARKVGVDPETAKWPSRTAKLIHPTGVKPCRRCGAVMRIAYAYPNRHLLRRLRAEFGDDLEINMLESLPDLVQRLVDTYGDAVLLKLPKLLETRDVKPQPLGTSLDDWLTWIEDDYIPAEPSLLSPGAMSNAPDRFDGFHHFNRCCRRTADTGRHDTNMRSYTTDRRVFEYWSEGDWIAADRLMGRINAIYRDHAAADGGEGPCTADHIGPLSLGFMHRPEFRLLSRAANSAKNNRMSQWDVDHLKATEAAGVPVASWHARPLWDLRKGDVVNDETALRLSKLLRDNQRVAMRLLYHIFQAGRFAFLSSLLELLYADRNVEFVDLLIDDAFVTRYSDISTSARTTKYTEEQQARRLRVAFESLRAYGAKENRHLFEVADPQVDVHVARAIDHLAGAAEATHRMDADLGELIRSGDTPSEDILREIASRASHLEDTAFTAARAELEQAMQVVASRISEAWDSDRYVRAEFDLEPD